MKISVTILTKNSAKHLQDVLEALSSFDEIVLLDNGSTDNTLDIAKHCTIYKSPFIGFGPLHNKASSLAANDWILSIDSDEIMTPELAQEIHSLKLNDACVYSFERHTYYRGRLIKGCGWYPDRIIRLYNRKTTKFSDDLVHERIIKLQEIKLKNAVIHYSYTNISDFLDKMQSYSTLFAQMHRGKKKSSPLIAIQHALGAFFKSYILKRGFLDGYPGLLISGYQAHTAFYKYMKLYELNLNLISKK